MENNKRISELLVETKAYTDLDQPVILTSGALGIYYINTEKLCQDGGEFEKYGEKSGEMIQHAVRMMKEHPTFEEVIDILAEKVKEVGADTISGGQRRDWIFSGPVAAKLDMPHVSLYKDGKVELVAAGKGKAADVQSADSYSLDCQNVVHIVDLITEASSCYRKEGDKEKGWIPMLRKEGAYIKDLLAVVTRLQGGEERLASAGVKVTPFVAIDEDFLRIYSKDPERALAYQADPEAWSRNYLRENGALALLPAFNPEGGKLDRAKKFLDRYRSVLCTTGKIHELDRAVHDKYGKHLEELFKGGE